MIGSPSASKIIIAGIPIPAPVPPIGIGSVGTLLTTTTAIAPAASADATLTVKLHSPLRTTAIFPFSAPALVILSHPS